MDAIRRLSAAGMPPLRRAVRRPNRPADACRDPGDGAPSSAPGVDAGGALASVAPVYHEPAPATGASRRQADPRGDELDLPRIGPHYPMVRILDDR